MKTIQAMFMALAGTSAFFPLAAMAEPVRCEATGNYYEAIDFTCGAFGTAGECWQGARVHAATLPSIIGATPDLATITSAEEQLCVEEVWDAWRDISGNNPEAWIGGFQQQPASGVADNWFWINDEGAISPPGSMDGYENWGASEPNDVNSPAGETGGEDHLGFGLGGIPTWNDEGAKGNIGGAILEYVTSTQNDVNNCQGVACSLNPLQTIQYADVTCTDESGDCDDATLSAQSWEETDVRVAAGTCGQELLNLFLVGGNIVQERDSDPDAGAFATLPPHLCGHPKFIVTKTEAEGFVLGNTAAIVESDPPAGNKYVCGPIDLEEPIDNTLWDVTAYQTDDKSNMVETHVPLTGTATVFAGGTVLETLFDCGSSRGKSFNRSWHFSGLCIASDIDGCPDVAPSTLLIPGNIEFMNEFLIYKLERTLEVILEAQGNNAFKRKNDFKYLKKQVSQAIKLARKGNYNATYSHIRNAQRRLARTRFNLVPDEFYAAELETRLDNSAFTSKNRILQYVKGF